jgi:hypothetical protein
MGPKVWILAAVLLSTLLSVGILASRNLLDDELSTLPIVTQNPSQILAIAAEGDIHPPGMYLLAHLSWRIFPGYRWFNLIPLSILYLGLGFFLLQALPRTLTRTALAIGLIFAAFHPEFLMWSNTFRWFCPWTGLALMALVLFLQPQKAAWTFKWYEAIVGGFLLAAMFYLNYITLIFLGALTPALWLRLQRNSAPQALRGLCLCLALFLALCAPQLHTMVDVHLANSSEQRSTLVVSALRLTQAITGSEAYLPWHPLPLLAGVAVALALASGCMLLCGNADDTGDAPSASLRTSQERVLILFAALFLLVFVLAGLGGKPRSAILLLPVLAPAVARGAERLRKPYRIILLLVFACWSCVGAAHLIGRFGLQKASLNERPEEVASLIQRNLRPGAAQNLRTQNCGIAVTYDDAAAFQLAQRHIPQLMILSAERGALFAGTLQTLPQACTHPHLYLIRSYLSGMPEKDGKYTAQLDAALQFLQEPPAITNLDPDPDAAGKRRLSRWLGLSAGDALPDFRFTVLSGQLDRSRVPALRTTLHYFTSGDEIVRDWSVPAPDKGEENPHSVQP